MAVGKTVQVNEQALASDINKMAGWGVAAARPATGDVLAGSFYFSTDTNVLEQEQNGAWVAVLQTEAIVAGAETYAAGYHAGNVGGLSAIDADLTPANIKKDVNIFGKVGTLIATITELLSIQGTTYISDWGGSGWNFQLKVSDTVPAAAQKVMLLLATSAEGADPGGKILYNGVERVLISQNSGVNMGSLCRWLGNGIGSSATVEYWPKGVDSQMCVWFAQCWYTT